MFAFPQYGYWIIAAILGGYVCYRAYLHHANIIRVWFSRHEYRQSLPYTKFLLRVGALLCLLLALLGPYFSTSSEGGSAMGREIYIVLDVSASMNCEDVRPSRMRKIKHELKDLLKTLKGDKVGIIAFTDNAYTQCPLTSDLRTVSLFLDLVQTEQFSQTGTNFRAGLGVALERLQTSRAGKRDVSQGIILISDGEDFGESYGSVVDRLQDAYIKVFSVGIGTYEGAPVPKMENGQMNGYIQTADGTNALSKLSDDHLKSLSNTFDTEYISLTMPHEGLTRLSEQLYSLSYSPMALAQEKVENNMYQLFLLLAIGLLGASMVIMPIRNT
jgi:Ca-activated chloride channel family protein